MTKKEPDKQYYTGIGIALGISIGTLLGIVLDNFPLWLGSGLAIGVCVGASMDAKNHKKDKDNTDPKDENDKK